MSYSLDADSRRWRGTPYEPPDERQQDARAKICPQGARAAQRAGADAEARRGARQDPLAALAEDRSGRSRRVGVDAGAARGRAEHGAGRPDLLLSAGTRGRTAVSARALLSCAALMLSDAACGAPHPRPSTKLTRCSAKGGPGGNRNLSMNYGSDETPRARQAPP